MGSPILTTKIYIPPLNPQSVLRPRLIEKINEGQHAKLTLVCASAGSGKTTLLSEWAASTSRSVAMVSLDENDNELHQFFTYLAAALQIIDPAIAKGANGMLAAGQMPPVETLLAGLLNEIAESGISFSLILDDYHIIDNRAIDQALAFVLEHMPRNMHLVIVTREDPMLPLAKLRAKGQMNELRAAELRFSSAEAADFLNQVMNLNLTEKEIETLEERTEGWVAGLQLAALSMQGEKDIAGFIDSFTGSHHFVMDYLTEEVLKRRPEKIQKFLLHTSILTRLNGDLCDAVMNDSLASGQETLERLQHANIFLVSLDNERRWYRYHHLFAQLLRRRLQQNTGLSLQNQPVNIKELHLRAAHWLEKNDDLSEAFSHAAAANDFELAANLAELSYLRMNANFQTATWLGWVKKLPDEMIRKRPVLSVQYAMVLVDKGNAEAVEERLVDAEKWLNHKAGIKDKMVVSDEKQFEALPAKIRIARAGNAQAQGDIDSTIKHARAALALTSKDDNINHAFASGILGAALWTNGDFKGVIAALEEIIKKWQKISNFSFEVVTISAIADIKVNQGRLHEALSVYKKALLLASKLPPSSEHVTANLHLGLGMLYHELGLADLAAGHLQKSANLGEQTLLVDWPYLWRLAQAQLMSSTGDLEAALNFLDEAKNYFIITPRPNNRSREALKANVYIKQGRLGKVQEWIKDHNLSINDKLSFMREFEHITLAKMLITMGEDPANQDAQKSLLDAQKLLSRLLEAAQKGERTAGAIEILILQTRAYQLQGNLSKAFASLELALEQAEPEGYVQTFVNEGLPIMELLKRMDDSYEQGRPVIKRYIHKLLAHFEKRKEIALFISHQEESSLKNESQPLVEPLSKREQEILQLIAGGFSNREISDKLALSLNTIKGHNRNIFGKLGVDNRAKAVLCSRRLGLL